MVDAGYYDRGPDGAVHCRLCRFHCVIADGGRGACHVRENRDGRLYSLVYGRVIARQVDPIEKKPLFHVRPGLATFSIATAGCNFRCRHCQNFAIAQVGPRDEIRGIGATPDQVVQAARESGCGAIAYTYTEPTIYFEFARDTARLAAAAGLLNLFVTNGYIEQAPLADIAPVLHAANIDLKGFSDRFYREVVGARLADVLETIVDYRRQGVWLEITTLVIPGLNDSDEELGGIAAFMVEHLGRETPWHVSRFHPTHRLTDRPPTPVETVQRAAAIGRAAGLKHVYIGNSTGTGSEDTTCPDCSGLLIQRTGYRIVSNRLSDRGGCPDCGRSIPGIW
jgi:pyruvate formate lyase activating enzyme